MITVVKFSTVAEFQSSDIILMGVNHPFHDQCFNRNVFVIYCT